MEAVFYKMAMSEPAKMVFCTPEGRIDFAGIGEVFRLNPASIILNGGYIPRTGLNSRSKWKEIKKSFKKYKLPRGRESDPVLVTGEALVAEAPVATASTEPTEVSNKLNLLIDLMRQNQEKLNQNQEKLNLSHDFFLRSLFPPSISSETSANYRRNAISKYICPGEEKASGKLFCSVTGHWFSENVVVAGHIYMKKWHSIFMGEILGLDVHSPENILFLLDCVKKKFDSFDFCVIPEAQDTFRTRILNPAIRSVEVHKDLGKLSFGDLDNRKLSFTTGNRPAKRLFGFRATWAIKHAEGRGWIEKGAIIVPDEAWASPQFDQKLMSKFLHDLNPEDGLDGSGGGLKVDLGSLFDGASTSRTTSN